MKKTVILYLALLSMCLTLVEAQALEQIKANHDQLLTTNQVNRADAHHAWVHFSFSCPKCGCPAYTPGPDNSKICVQCGHQYTRDSSPEAADVHAPVVSAYIGDDKFYLYTEAQNQKFSQDGTLSKKEGSVELRVTTKLDEGATTLEYTIACVKLEAILTMKFYSLVKAQNISDNAKSILASQALNQANMLYPCLQSQNIKQIAAQAGVVLWAFANTGKYRQPATSSPIVLLNTFRFTPGYTQQIYDLPQAVADVRWEIHQIWNVASYTIKKEITHNGFRVRIWLEDVKPTNSTNWGMLGVLYYSLPSANATGDTKSQCWENCGKFPSHRCILQYEHVGDHYFGGCTHSAGPCLTFCIKGDHQCLYPNGHVGAHRFPCADGMTAQDAKKAETTGEEKGWTTVGQWTVTSPPVSPYPPIFYFTPSGPFSSYKYVVVASHNVNASISLEKQGDTLVLKVNGYPIQAAPWDISGLVQVLPAGK